jgi:hypothetical protein
MPCSWGRVPRLAFGWRSFWSLLGGADAPDEPQRHRVRMGVHHERGGIRLGAHRYPEPVLVPCRARRGGLGLAQGSANSTPRSARTVGTSPSGINRRTRRTRRRPRRDERPPGRRPPPTPRAPPTDGRCDRRVPGSRRIRLAGRRRTSCRARPRDVPVRRAPLGSRSTPPRGLLRLGEWVVMRRW